MTLRTRTERDAARRRAKKIALVVGVVMAAIDAFALIGMLTHLVPVVPRTYIAPAGWAGLYLVLTAPGRFLAASLTLGLLERAPIGWTLVLCPVLSGCAWYAIARAAMWSASEFLPARGLRGR